MARKAGWRLTRRRGEAESETQTVCGISLVAARCAPGGSRTCVNAAS
jgi:hypothetical protein